MERYASGFSEARKRAETKIAMAWEEGYNKGKTDGIELAKRAFAKAIKQKDARASAQQEKSNDVLRQN